MSGERDDVGEVGLWLKSVGPDHEEDAPADEADEDRCKQVVSLGLPCDKQWPSLTSLLEESGTCRGLKKMPFWDESCCEEDAMGADGTKIGSNESL